MLPQNELLGEFRYPTAPLARPGGAQAKFLAEVNAEEAERNKDLVPAEYRIPTSWLESAQRPAPATRRASKPRWTGRDSCRAHNVLGTRRLPLGSTARRDRAPTGTDRNPRQRPPPARRPPRNGPVRIVQLSLTSTDGSSTTRESVSVASGQWAEATDGGRRPSGIVSQEPEPICSRWCWCRWRRKRAYDRGDITPSSPECGRVSGAPFCSSSDCSRRSTRQDPSPVRTPMPCRAPTPDRH